MAKSQNRILKYSGNVKEGRKGEKRERIDNMKKSQDGRFRNNHINYRTVVNAQNKS